MRSSPRLILAAVLLGSCTTPAAAHAQPPGDTWILPRDGASRPASSWPDATSFEMLEFTLYVVDDDGGATEAVAIEVSTSPATDADGTLAAADVIAAYVATPREGFPEILSARTSLADRWLATPGTYFWQARSDDFTTPVRALRITPAVAADPPTPPAPAAPVLAPVAAARGATPRPIRIAGHPRRCAHHRPLSRARHRQARRPR